MVGSDLRQAESIGSQRQNPFVNLERRRDREGSVHSARTGRSQSQGKGHLSQEENTRALQLEVIQQKRKLRHAQRRRATYSSDASPDGEEDDSYRQRSKTPPSEFFSYEEEHHHKRKHKSPPRKIVGNAALGKALDQISKLPFTRRIERTELPRRFTQPAFTMYNGKTDLVEHVSHFNQRMVVHSRDKALMCKVFPSSLGPIAIRWFNSLKPDSINSFKELTQAFSSRFITCNRVPRPISSLLSLSMREGETLKTYSDRY